MVDLQVVERCPLRCVQIARVRAKRKVCYFRNLVGHQPVPNVVFVPVRVS